MSEMSSRAQTIFSGMQRLKPQHNDNVMRALVKAYIYKLHASGPRVWPASQGPIRKNLLQLEDRRKKHLRARAKTLSRAPKMPRLRV